MANATKYSSTGASSGTATLDDHTFGIEPNVSVMHQVVTNQLATRRAGTQSTKTRSEVRGGGAKPFRQKGTGNARQGSIRAPHYVGGGVALGPKPRKYGKKTPKKMINLALRSALSDRCADGKVIVVDSWSFDKPSTREAEALLDKIGIDNTALVVISREDPNAVLSMRNLPHVQVCEPAELNAYDVLVNTYVVFAEADLPAFEVGSKRVAASKGTAKADTATKADKADKSDAATKADKADTAKKADKADKAAATKAAAAADEAETTADPTTEDAEDTAVATFADTGASAPAADDGDFPAGEWAGSVVADADGNGPESHPIKGNANSMLYHLPGTSFYKRTKAEVWFDTEEHAKEAGFQLPPSQREESDK